jgi:hypothetical protein
MEVEQNNGLFECTLQYLTEGTDDNPNTDNSDSSLYEGWGGGSRTGNRSDNSYIATMVRVKQAQLQPCTP